MRIVHVVERHTAQAQLRKVFADSTLPARRYDPTLLVRNKHPDHEEEIGALGSDVCTVY